MFSNTFAGLYKKWLVYLYNTADVIITPTPYSKSLLESYDLNKEIYAISNGVDVEQFNPTSEQINEFIQKFNISANDKLVISVGWLFERKGFDTFVEVAREMPNIKFMWFGDVKLSNPTSKIKNYLKNYQKMSSYQDMLVETLLKAHMVVLMFFSFHRAKKQKELLC